MLSNHIFTTDKTDVQPPSNCGPTVFFSDAEARQLVYQTYGMVDVAGVEMADLFRYAVIYKFGGVYLDVDVACVLSANQWLSEYRISYNPDLVVGVEFYTPLQFVQWAFLGSAQSTVMLHVLHYIRKYRLPLFSPGADPVQRTGPVAFTAGVVDYIKSMCKPRHLHISDIIPTHFRCEDNNTIVVLPYRAFGTPGYHPPEVRTTGQVLLRHRFRGSWK